MRVNVYAEEMTDRVELVTKTIDGHEYVGVRFYLELPCTPEPQHLSRVTRGPFIHRNGDDDSSAVTFWGKRDLRIALLKALDLLDQRSRDRQDADVEAGKIMSCPRCNPAAVFRFGPHERCADCHGAGFVEVPGAPG